MAVLCSKSSRLRWSLSSFRKNKLVCTRGTKSVASCFKITFESTFLSSPVAAQTLNCLDCSSWILLAYLIYLDFLLHLVAHSKVLKFSSCTEQIYVGYQTNLSNRCWQRLIKHQPTTCQWNRTKCATNNFTRTSWLLNVSISIFSKVS